MPINYQAYFKANTYQNHKRIKVHIDRQQQLYTDQSNRTIKKMKKTPEDLNINQQDEQKENNLQKDQQQSDNLEHTENNMNQSHIEQQNPQPDLQQQQYDEYGLYNEQDGDMEMWDQSLESMGYKMSSENNTQCEMQDLVKIINKETIKVMELTGFDQFWALIYYQTCGWRMNIVSTFIDQKLSSHKMICYKAGTASMSSLDGMCDVCCLENQIIFKNMCGDEFCEDCWKNHLKQKLKTFNTEPFPPCLNSQCKVKASPFIMDEIAKNDQQFKKLYLRTLCRSYAIGNTSVKMCKGRQKFSCDRCFKVNKLFQLIQCQCCQNLVCGRCGQQYHFPSECFQWPNWRRVVQGSTNFIQNLNYRICPSCKQAVERSSGCNSMVCKCKQTFCYICGEKWLPNHTTHGKCYREKEIKSLNEERKRKRANEKEYLDKLESFKAEIEKYMLKMRQVDAVNVDEIKTKLIARFKVISNELDYLEPLKRQLRIALRIAKGYVLSLYFKDNQVLKAQLSTLTPLIEQSYDYLMYSLNNLILADSRQGKLTKDAIIMSKKIKEKELVPQQYLAQSKIKMLGIIKGIDKYISN